VTVEGRRAAQKALGRTRARERRAAEFEANVWMQNGGERSVQTLKAHTRQGMKCKSKAVYIIECWCVCVAALSNAQGAKVAGPFVRG
jgi:hypothetical protein